MKKWSVLICMIWLFSACKEEVFPKPKPYLKLQYPTAVYQKILLDCPYEFEISRDAILSSNKNCWTSISYPNLKATIHITYKKIDHNLVDILKDVEKLTFEHTVKADAIPSAVPYENFEKKVFGKLYNVEGNVATNIQFVATDSVNHVLSGALYFYTRPNYDSILPAIKYIEKDIVHLVESINWK